MASGTTNAIISAGGGASNDFALLTPTFMAKNKAPDITLSVNTTWDDAIGYKRVGKLTINAGIVLKIGKFPFFIFADEIYFGSTTSHISADGLSGGNSSATQVTYPTYMSAGGSAYRPSSGAGEAFVQGGCGGGLLFVFANKITGANGKITANGGNGNGGATMGDSNNAANAGQGALDNALSSESPVYDDYDFFREGISLAQYAYDGGTGSSLTRKTFSSFRGTLSMILARSGYGSGGFAFAGQSGYTINQSTALGGSGIGAGGSVSYYSGVAGEVAAITPTVNDLLMLARIGCRGGGGGCAVIGGNSHKHAGGGGGGGLVVHAHELTATPTVTANGGAGFKTSPNAVANGTAGVAYLIEG